MTLEKYKQEVKTSNRIFLVMWVLVVIVIVTTVLDAPSFVTIGALFVVFVFLILFFLHLKRKAKLTKE